MLSRCGGQTVDQAIANQSGRTETFNNSILLTVADNNSIHHMSLSTCHHIVVHGARINCRVVSARAMASLKWHALCYGVLPRHLTMQVIFSYHAILLDGSLL